MKLQMQVSFTLKSELFNVEVQVFGVMKSMTVRPIMEWLEAFHNILPSKPVPASVAQPREVL